MKVGIIGLGTVGEGVLKVLTLEKENIKIKSNCELEVKYACDLNIDRQFSFDFDKNVIPRRRSRRRISLSWRRSFHPHARVSG